MHKADQNKDSITAQACALIDKGEYQAALACLATLPSRLRLAEACYLAGRACRGLESDDRAVAAFLEAIEIDPRHAPAMAALADMAAGTGDMRSALTYISAALQVKPDDPEYRGSLILYFGDVTITAFNPGMKNLILTCLEADDVAHTPLTGPWLALLRLDPAFEPFVKLLDQPSYKTFKKHMLNAGPCALWADPYLLLGLARFIVPDMGFEIFLTHMRRFLLESNNPVFDALRCALAQYCFQTGYVFNAEPDEMEMVARLDTGTSGDWRTAVTYGLYAPLYKVENADGLSRLLHAASPEAASVARIQIDEPLEERRLRDDIECLTAIEDETSRAVQAQYETFPYPRWLSTNRAQSYYKAIGAYDDDGARMLVMGTGTGMEAINLSCAFPGADILAVDLSRASLAYGMRKAREMGLRNIAFKQADILELKSLNMQFDMIVSWGVLHHMRDPAEGFSVLSDLLVPGGLARIALYSQVARAPFAPMMELAAEQFGKDAASIRAFRQAVPRAFKGDGLTRLYNVRDYYSMEEARDFLFHVMEHRVDIPCIQKWLVDFNLEFMTFLLRPQIHRAYKQAFPGDPKGGTLAHWAAFERDNPATFLETYAFWCRKQS